jgi:hypothetical protein
MCRKGLWIWGLLQVLLCLNVVTAGVLAPAQRDVTPTTTIAPTTTATATATSDQTTSATQTDSDPSSTESVTVQETSTSVNTSTAVPSALNGNSPNKPFTSDNGKWILPPSEKRHIRLIKPTRIATTIAEGELPLDPRLTPGWGVAGIILLLTGAVYALIGIKKAWLHTFFSNALLAGMSTTVLIIYVMITPVTDTIQGAYVVAVVCTGLILGGGALVFKEMTESLGCLLGGFCVSMWLLTLRDGGLITSGMGKIIFIVVGTCGGFALYFSRWTRIYALIFSISFSGATATVIGLDCFTRAGLKEFWAYIWALNDNLFPYGVNTYPLTKGIRVEIALIAILCLAGIISQLKLWKVIQEHRIKRQEARDEADMQRELEEANVGRQIEEQAARERREWEARYGDKTPGSPIGSGDSGVSDLNEKKGSRESQTIVGCPTDEDNVIELAELPASNTPGDGIEKPPKAVLATRDEQGRVVIRVAAEDDGDTPPQDAEGKEGADGDVRPASSISVRNASQSGQPEVTTLPFRIPDNGAEDDDDRSSCATFADDDEHSLVMANKSSRRSVGNRLSVETGRPLSRLSARSLRSTNSKATAGGSSPVKSTPEFGESHEVLVSDAGQLGHDGDAGSAAGSVAATGDGASVHEPEAGNESSRPDFTMEITADLGDRESQVGSVSTAKDPNALRPKAAGKHVDIRSHSPAEIVGTDILNVSVVDEPTGTTDSAEAKDTTQAAEPTGAPEATEPTPKQDSPASDEAKPEAAPAEAQAAANTPKPEAKANKSKRVFADSTPAGLSKGLLPKNLSRVTSAYRTNEWAKHLSQADTPEPETLQLNQVVLPDEVPETEDNEAAAPVNIVSLQQTAETGTPAPAVIQVPSTLANSAPGPGFLHRSNSRVSSNMGQSLGVNSVMGQPQDWPQAGRSTFHPPQASMKYRNRDSFGRVSDTTAADGYASGALQPSERVSSEHQFDQQAMYRPPVPGVVPYSSPQTLLGKRDMLIRQRLSLMNAPGPDTRVFSVPMAAPSDTGSMHNFPVYAMPDVDDLPLSQRKELMRRSSLLSSTGSHVLQQQQQSPQHGVPYIAPGQPPMPDSVAVHTHQPQRVSTLQSTAVRDAQLASFRQSVAAELRSSAVHYPPPVHHQHLAAAARELRGSVSMNALGGGGGGSGMMMAAAPPVINREEVQQRLDHSRHILLSQREMEVRRREAERLEKERNDRMFEEHMRSGYLMDAHRDAMRRLQSNAREK